MDSGIYGLFMTSDNIITNYELGRLGPIRQCQIYNEEDNPVINHNS